MSVTSSWYLHWAICFEELFVQSPLTFAILRHNRNPPLAPSGAYDTTFNCVDSLDTRLGLPKMLTFRGAAFFSFQSLVGLQRRVAKVRNMS